MRPTHLLIFAHSVYVPPRTIRILTIKISFLDSISAKATYAAIANTYSYLTPDLWKETVFTKSPYQEFTDYLVKNHRPVGSQRQEVKQY